MSGYFDMDNNTVIKAIRDGEEMLNLYERALNTIKMYLCVKRGAGNAHIASSIINEILNDDVFRGDGVEKFRIENHNFIISEAKKTLNDDEFLRSFIGSTLWVKWLEDKAFQRNKNVSLLESGWAFKVYSNVYPMPTLKEYQKQVIKFEDLLKYKLGEYLNNKNITKND